ncbi:MAG: alpha-L-rhamnosidase N-terminal domain-containing protein [Victivallales bacterium]|nr:alpha-L-rhamnosidase N-terminal domain-containing protein [Victivallales bacterium]
MDISASWIWSDDSDGRDYNLCSIFRRDFRLETVPESAHLKITADSYYRLKVNGQWLGDGPARAYPEHYQYEVYDLNGILRSGQNQIEATVRYYGCGTFHQIPQRAGFLAQLEMTNPDQIIVSDENFFAAKVPQWITSTVKSSIQLPPYEIFDASILDKLDWKPATKICAAQDGAYRDLHERDCKILSRHEFLLRRFVGGNRVQKAGITIAVSPKKIYFPGDVTANCSDVLPLLVAFRVKSPRTQTIRFGSLNLNVSVNGQISSDDKITLKQGDNLIVAASNNLSYGHLVDSAITLPADAELEIQSCYDTSGRIAVVDLSRIAHLSSDIPFREPDSPNNARYEEFSRVAEAALKIQSANEFCQKYPEVRLFERSELSIDPYPAFMLREVQNLQANDLENPDALIFNDDSCTVVNPTPGCDVELCYDLGEQNVGFWNFALFAASGTVIDLTAIEYITPDGRLQHTRGDYRNGMRYICREGYNRYSSLHRRSGRYLFITIRNAAKPVRIQLLRLIESTYPVVPEGEFHASDLRLERIYEISARTLKLCMEDTFTDCPLYEQTLWVGDARNESLFAMSCFGAYDLVRRCIRLAGQSLERFPLVGSQVPSGWSSIIPVWSFLWGMSVEDYCYETGDLKFGREVWPMVIRNLDGAKALIDPVSGLFSCYDWNLFEWSKTDCSHPTMLYNSMFLVATLSSAIRLGESLNEPMESYKECCEKLKKAINNKWDSRKLAWPDSIHADGTVSEDVSMHTSMLALLYDIAESKFIAAARANTVTPRPELIKIGSPFALLYLYLSLEKLGMPDEIMKNIYRDYMPMLELGSTTVWESFPRGTNTPSDFPSRSHCHGWSAAPLYFLPRLILGIVPESPGATKFGISPRISDLEHASGARPTVHGRIEVSWVKKGNQLHINAHAPQNVELNYRKNDTHADFEVFFNQKVVN